MIDDPVLVNDWHVVARASEIKEGEVKAVRLLRESLVLWRNAEGIHVWRDLCIHRGAQLSFGKVKNGCLECPYHGWTYDSEGQCTKFPAHPEQTPPARASAEAYHVKVKYDLVWVCLGTPAMDVPEFPEWEDATYRKVPCGPYFLKASGPRLIENFLDVGHLAFVHAGLLGDPERPEIEDYEVEMTDDVILAHDIGVWQPDPDGTGIPGRVSYNYIVSRPLTAVFFKAQGPQRFVMFEAVTPVEECDSVAWVILAINYAPDLAPETLREFQDKVTFQDVPIVESQRPEMLPLDLQAELHLRSDRAAIAYRQWLKKRGLKFGTS
jgi:phenylpropionate dioxygenase-like ring-hydroxylating dioxygenase large terminal subunit